MTRLAPLVLLSLLACNTTVVAGYDDCSIAINPTPAAGLPGDFITLDGGPFSVTWDTVVRVGGVDASVTDVVRADCDTCDTCRADADCLSCGACADCDAVCATCVQTVVFLVPDVTPGVQPVVMYNQHGTSEVASVEVLGASTDTDTPADTDVVAPPSP